MARFATEEDRIKNAITPTNRDLLNFVRNAEGAAAKRVDWEGREKIIEAWRSSLIEELAEWIGNESANYPHPKEWVYILLNVAQFIQADILETEKDK